MVVWDLGCVDSDLWSSPGWQAATVRGTINLKSSTSHISATCGWNSKPRSITIYWNLLSDTGDLVCAGGGEELTKMLSINSLMNFPECLTEIGYDYGGSNVVWISQGGQATVESCREYCRDNCPACRYFTHYNGGCWCKTSNAGRSNAHSYGNAITAGHICPKEGERKIKCRFPLVTVIPR